MLSVIVPANNEEALIEGCLRSVFDSHIEVDNKEVIVAANGCNDRTVPLCHGMQDEAAAQGWRLVVLDLAEGGKLGALNAADAAAQGDIRAYLDADVTVSQPLLAQVAALLDRPEAAYASGRVNIKGGGGWISAAYARLWSKVPFMTTGVPGCGLFAVNAAGRARWGEWPAIISDDTFVRLQFRPDERHLAQAAYDWPIASGFSRLVRVRRRQDDGVDEIRRTYPDILQNDDTPSLGLAGYASLALRNPLAFAVYAAVSVAVRLKGPETEWSRSR